MKQRFTKLTLWVLMFCLLSFMLPMSAMAQESSVERNYILFGEYPQSRITGMVSVDEKPEAVLTLEQEGGRWTKANNAPDGSGNFCTYYKYDPIKWRVLEKIDNEDNTITLKLLSQDILTGQKYHDTLVTWDISDLREWLNGTEYTEEGRQENLRTQPFYATAFSNWEKELIIPSEITNQNQNEHEPNYNEYDGNYTCTDKVYLLSYSDEEAGNAEYFTGQDDLVADHTEYGAYYTHNSIGGEWAYHWLLRGNYGSYENFNWQQVIAKNGKWTATNNFDKINNGIRPAITITVPISHKLTQSGTFDDPWVIEANPSITFNPNGGTVNTASSFTQADGTLASLPIPTRSKYTFDGWFTELDGGTPITTDTVFLADTTIYAHWTYKGGGGGSYDYYDIKIICGENGTISPDGGSDNEIRIREYRDQTFNMTANEGYRIADVLIDGKSIDAVSSYTFKNVKKDHTIEVKFAKGHETTATGVALDKENHFAYMVGVGEGKFEPNRNITRAETVVMFSRLLIEKMKEDTTYTSSFTDISGDKWYANAIGYMEQFGIVTGYKDNTFRPDQPITRAEFAAVASRFEELSETDGNLFSDVTEDYWAAAFINSAAAKGWVNGYPDGTFKPAQNITRAEAVSLANHVLDRSADELFISKNLSELNSFTDVTERHWAYHEILEAANGHRYTKEKNSEIWTALK